MKRLTSPSIVAFLGLALVIFVFGVRIIDPTNTSWISGDAATMQFGWEQYRADPTQLFSLSTNRASWPLPMSVSLFDNIPIVVLLLRPIAAFLPEHFQYLGIAFAFSVMLQGGFSVLFLREALRKIDVSWEKTVSIIIGATLVTAAPILYSRFFMGHISLSFQWLIMAALWVYVRSDRVSHSKTTIAFSIIAFFTASVNPYLLMMIYMVYMAYLIKIAADKCKYTHYISATAPIIIGFLSLMMFGFFDPSSHAVPTKGYGFYSANFNAFINPIAKQLGSAFLPELSVAIDGQQDEGYGYLGLGGIIIVALGLVRARSKNILYNKISAPLLISALISIFLAMSFYLSFGKFMTIDLGNFVVDHAPNTISSALKIFRSSGRFIWVSYYIFILLGVYFIVVTFSRRQSLAILSLCAALQIADLAKPFAIMHARFSALQTQRFTDPIYANLGRAHDTLIVLPPWQCEQYDYLLGHYKADYNGDNFEPISMLAADNHLRTNSFYAGRLLTSQAEYHCKTFPRQFPYTPPDKRTVYMFGPRAFKRDGEHVLQSHFCDYASKMFVCRADLGRVGLSDRARAAMNATKQQPKA